MREMSRLFSRHAPRIHKTLKVWVMITTAHQGNPEIERRRVALTRPVAPGPGSSPGAPDPWHRGRAQALELLEDSTPEPIETHCTTRSGAAPAALDQSHSLRPPTTGTIVSHGSGPGPTHDPID